MHKPVKQQLKHLKKEQAHTLESRSIGCVAVMPLAFVPLAAALIVLKVLKFTLLFEVHTTDRNPPNSSGIQ